MYDFQIITDSACDLPMAKMTEWNIHSAPLTLNLRGQTRDDSVSAGIEALYADLRAGEVATTSAVNPAHWEQIMDLYLEQGKDILAIAFSSGLSTTYQSAVIAAEDLKEKYPQRKIIVVDSLSASLGEGLLVRYACKKRDEGATLEETAQWLEDNKLHLCHWFTVDDLMYLKRGGRVSATTALVGTMLKIKPVMHMDNAGHLINMAKARGRKASIEALANKVAELGEGYDNSTMFICHGDCLEDAQYLEKLLREKYDVKEVLIGYTGAVIGSHSGPGTLALFFMGKER